MSTFLTLAADYEFHGEVSGGIGAGMVIVYLLFIVVIFAAWWKIFEKAGKPGWAGIVPIYNLMVLAEICGKPSWWGLLCLIPFVGFIVMILLFIELATRFGKSGAFAVGLILLGFIFFPILGFGDAKYSAPGAPPAAA